MSSVEIVLPARPRDLGGGLTVGRVLPTLARRFVGPFVFLDHMGPADVSEIAVRPHPHLHLATVTYLFEGAILHRDTLGSKQLIAPGEINWMVAGRGIAHSERSPDPHVGSRLHGLQIWVGLPRAQEDSAPSFEHVTDLPVVDEPGIQLRVLAGTAFGKTSPVTTMSPLFYVDVALAAGRELAVPAGFADRAAYVIDGALAIDDVRIEPRHMAVFTAGGTPVLRAERDTRLVLIGGEPLDGPRYLWWNFVSSSRERIVAAAEDWRAGRFPKIPDDDREFTPAPDGPHFAKDPA